MKGEISNFPQGQLQNHLESFTTTARAPTESEHKHLKQLLTRTSGQLAAEARKPTSLTRPENTPRQELHRVESKVPQFFPKNLSRGMLKAFLRKIAYFAKYNDTESIFG